MEIDVYFELLGHLYGINRAEKKGKFNETIDKSNKGKFARKIQILLFSLNPTVLLSKDDVFPRN